MNSISILSDDGDGTEVNTNPASHEHSPMRVHFSPTRGPMLCLEFDDYLSLPMRNNPCVSR